jgi:hypothetical protein
MAPPAAGVAMHAETVRASDELLPPEQKDLATGTRGLACSLFRGAS